MCEIKVFLLKDNKEELVLESVEFLKAEDGKIIMSNIFGEKKEIIADFKEFDNSNGKILLLPKQN